MNAPSPNPAPEYRSYRRFLSVLVLTLVSLGTAYLLSSVAIALYRQRNAVPTGDRVGTPMTEGELRGCWQELDDVLVALQKHVEEFHVLLGRYQAEDAQHWANEGTVWRTRWRLLGERCRFPTVGPSPRRKELEAMVAVWRDLDETERIYARELSRFGRDQTPRLDRIRNRLTLIGQRLEAESKATTAPPEVTQEAVPEGPQKPAPEGSQMNHLSEQPPTTPSNP